MFKNRIQFQDSKICLVKSVNAQILYIVVKNLCKNLVKKVHFTFKTAVLAGQFGLMKSALSHQIGMSADSLLSQSNQMFRTLQCCGTMFQ